MPKYWLTSKPAPNPPVLDWLKWSGQDLKHRIAGSGTIGAIIGIGKMGDLQTIYSPIIIPNALLSGSSTIIGNTSNKHTEPSFVYSDASDIGSIMVDVTYDDIPSELRPEENLSLRTVADTSWASAKIKLGMVQSLMFAPIFFRQKTVVSSVHNPNFEDQWGRISPAHR
jgi:hypothetical protein